MRQMFSKKQIEELSKSAVQSGLDNGSVVAPSPKFELFETGTIDNSELDLNNHLTNGLYLLNIITNLNLKNGLFMYAEGLESQFFIIYDDLAGNSGIEVSAPDVINFQEWNEEEEGTYKILKLK